MNTMNWRGFFGCLPSASPLLDFLDEEGLDEGEYLDGENKENDEPGGGQGLDAVHTLRSASVGGHDDGDDSDRNNPTAP